MHAYHPAYPPCHETGWHRESKNRSRERWYHGIASGEATSAVVVYLRVKPHSPGIGTDPHISYIHTPKPEAVSRYDHGDACSRVNFPRMHALEGSS
jgi:hypothetical protein